MRGPVDDDELKAVRLVTCPCCKGASVYAMANPYRPFCSARCKDMDFGAWADESFRMAQNEDPDGMTPTSGDRLQ